MSSLKNKIRKNFLFVELLLSLLITLILVLVSLVFGSKEDVLEWVLLKRSDFYPTIATIAGTLFGFVITGVSVILAFSNSKSKRIKMLKKSKHYETIFDIYFSTIRYLAFTTVIAIIGIMVIRSWVVLISFFLLIWGVIISSFRLWRCLWVLEKIIKISSKNE